MGRFFSPSTGGFYSEAVHGARLIELPLSEREARAGKRAKMVANEACRIPEDAIAVEAARYQQLMDAQAAGKAIVVRGGKPVAIESQFSTAEREGARRRQRDRLLGASDWTQLPDLPGSVDRQAWAAYRRALRDLDMNRLDWPAEPGATS